MGVSTDWIVSMSLAQNDEHSYSVKKCLSKQTGFASNKQMFPRDMISQCSFENVVLTEQKSSSIPSLDSIGYLSLGHHQDSSFS